MQQPTVEGSRREMLAAASSSSSSSECVWRKGHYSAKANVAQVSVVTVIVLDTLGARLDISCLVSVHSRYCRWWQGWENGVKCLCYGENIWRTPRPGEHQSRAMASQKGFEGVIENCWTIAAKRASRSRGHWDGTDSERRPSQRVVEA